MKLAPAAALTLRLTDFRLYPCPKSTEYLSRLDLSAADEIIERMPTEVKQYMEELMSSRKYFLREEANSFLEACEAMGKKGQVVLLGAGAAPLSIYLSEKFRAAQVWEISRDYVYDKKALLEPVSPNLHLIQCEISDHVEWADRLHFTGFDPTQPSLFVLESLYFYISSEEMRKIVCGAKQLNGIICGDFMVSQTSVSSQARYSLRATFEALQHYADFGRMRFYSRMEFASLLDVCGYRDIRFLPMSRIQTERSGSASPFETENGSPIEMWSVR